MLMQTSDYAEWFFIQCGSTSLSPAQMRYSTYNLELASITWEVLHRKDDVSSGLKFVILTCCRCLDYVELVDLQSVSSNRTHRCLEVLLLHNIQVNYISAKFNQIADFLSRHLKEEHQFPWLTLD